MLTSGRQAVKQQPAAQPPVVLTGKATALLAGYQELWRAGCSTAAVDSIAVFVMVHCVAAPPELIQEQEKQGGAAPTACGLYSSGAAELEVTTAVVTAGAAAAVVVDSV